MAEPVASTESVGDKRRWSHGICGATGARKFGWQWPLAFGPAAILLYDFPLRQDLAGAWHWEQISPPLLRMLASGIQLAVRMCDQMGLSAMQVEYGVGVGLRTRHIGYENRCEVISKFPATCRRSFGLPSSSRRSRRSKAHLNRHCDVCWRFGGRR